MHAERLLRLLGFFEKVVSLKKWPSVMLLDTAFELTVRFCPGFFTFPQAMGIMRA